MCAKAHASGKCTCCNACGRNVAHALTLRCLRMHMETLSVENIFRFHCGVRHMVRAARRSLLPASVVVLQGCAGAAPQLNRRHGCDRKEAGPPDGSQAAFGLARAIRRVSVTTPLMITRSASTRSGFRRRSAISGSSGAAIR